MDAIAIRYSDWEPACDRISRYGQPRIADDDITEIWRGAIAMQAIHPDAWAAHSPRPVVRWHEFSVVIPRRIEEAIAGLQGRFQEQADKWESETAFISSTPMRVLHDSYQSIMAMGPDVVPILLRDLQKTRRNWFWALRHLTNADPVPEKDKGNVDKMVAAWVEWGRREGRI